MEGVRIATVRVRLRERPEPLWLPTTLLEASPRVVAVDPELARVDARGWDRRGGEPALAERIREVLVGEGVEEVGIGIAGTAVAADVAAGRALRRGGAGTLIVPPGEEAAYLAGLPLADLPLPDALREILVAAGFHRIGELAARPLPELESRFGPEGVRALRRARGEDDGPFPTLRPDALPEAFLELPGGVDALEPLLFALRGLLARICDELRGEGRRAVELRLELRRERGKSREKRIRPARPTAREAALFDLCRAVLEERAPDDDGGPFEGLLLEVREVVGSGARQGELFARAWRDPLAASGALSRLRSRLGEAAVAVPASRSDHRPEGRDRWEPVRPEDPDVGDPRPYAGESRRDVGESHPDATGPLPPVLHLLPRPRPVRVRDREGRPVVLWDAEGRHEVRAAEGPERLSGDWWERPYRREYYRLCTAEGEILWVFREPRPGEDRWWLHGWWD